MTFTEKQKAWLIEQYKANKRIIDMDPRKGKVGLIVENNVISLLISLHDHA